MTRGLHLRSLGQSDFFQVFNFREDLAKGRSYIILSALLSGVYTYLINGIFFTGFLLENGLTMVDIGYITSIPLMCSFFGIFTPALLSRFKRRKLLLCGSRLVYLLLNILGITLVPVLPLSMSAKKVYIFVVVFLANAINHLFTTGFTAWHSNFLTEDIRPRYFSYQQIISGLTSFVTLLASGIVTDAVSASGESKLPIMMTLRFSALFFAVLEIWVLSRPIEFEYRSSTDRVSLLSTITVPFRYKNFIRCMLLVFIWTFATHLTTSAYQVYALNDLKVSYTVINTVDATYGWFIFFIVPFWRKYTLKGGWYRTLLVTTVPNCLTYFIALFIVPANGLWLYPLYRLIQHTTGVGFNYAFANIAYVHLPDADRTSCLSFHLLTSQAAGFLGLFTGTTLISALQGVTVVLPGLELNNLKLVLVLHCAINVLMIICVCRFTKRFAPAEKNK